MAQDLYFVALDRASEAKFDRSLICSILSRDAVEPVDSFYCAYPDGSHGEANRLDDKREWIDGLGFTHFGGRMMMERIYELADALDVFLVWTCVGDDEPNGCVTRVERLARAQSIAEDSYFVVARDPSHLNQLVKGPTFEENGW